MPQQQTKQVPLKALNFASEFHFGDNGEDAKSAPVSILAVSSEPKNHWYWGKCVHDMSGMQHKDRIPLDYCHNSFDIIGYANNFEVSNDGVRVTGALTPYKDDRATEVLYKAKQGVPYEASVNFAAGLVIEDVGEGMEVEVNGQVFEGPGVVFRKWTLRGVAICPYGEDSNTAAEFAANKDSEKTIEVQTMTTKKIIKKASEFSEENKTEETTAEPEATDNADGVEATETAEETQTEPETQADTPETETPEGSETQSVEGDSSNSEFSSAAQPFIKAFGEVKGSMYFCQGKTMEQATMQFAKEVQAENVELKAEVKSLKDKLEFAKANAGADLTEQSASDAKTNTDPEYTKLFNTYGKDKADSIWTMRQKKAASKAK